MFFFKKIAKPCSLYSDLFSSRTAYCRANFKFTRGLQKSCMYAIVQTGSKQYRVKKGDVINVELVNAEIGQIFDLQDVLLIARENGEIIMGKPNVPGCVVKAKYTKIVKGPKIHSVKYKRRKGEYRKFGHRQKYAELQIVDINV